MSKYVNVEDVLRILYECIVYVEVDESDHALVDYHKAKEMILRLG